MRKALRFEWCDLINFHQNSAKHVVLCWIWHRLPYSYSQASTVAVAAVLLDCHLYCCCQQQLTYFALVTDNPFLVISLSPPMTPEYFCVNFCQICHYLARSLNLDTFTFTVRLIDGGDFFFYLLCLFGSKCLLLSIFFFYPYWTYCSRSKFVQRYHCANLWHL